MSVATAVRKAAEAAARADMATIAAFAPSSVRLYAKLPPENPTYPHVILRADVVGDDTECGEASEVTLTADVYAKEAIVNDGAERVEAISNALRRALTAKLTLTGHVIDDWQFEDDREVGDPDPLIAHRSLSITYLTSASA